LICHEEAISNVDSPHKEAIDIETISERVDEKSKSQHQDPLKKT
jgi:hypothetical protein